MQTVLAKRVQGQLERNKAGVGNGPDLEGLREWFHEYDKRGNFTPKERTELRQLLKIDEDTPLEQQSFRDLVPNDTWFADLLDLQKESESPAPFFFLSGLSVMSQLVGRKVMIDRGTHRLGLDVSALLLSPAGRGRRSTACDFVVYEVGEPAGLKIIADSFTYEALGDGLCQTVDARPNKANPRVNNAGALVYAGEMSTLLGKGSYADSIIPKLTDIIGKTSRFNWQTVKRGKIEFVNPMVNALFTSAPDWLVENIPPVVFGGGMLSRFLICVRDMPEQVVTWGEAIDGAKLRKVIDRLTKISRVQGCFGKPGKEALEWYDGWYQEHMRQTLYGELPDERMAPYFSRKHDHLLRLTALLTIASSAPLVFTVERFEQALKIINWLELDIPKAYENMALSPLAAAQKKVIDTLKATPTGQMEINKLKRRMAKQLPLKEQFDSVIRTLIDMQVITSVRGVGQTSYRLQRELR